MKRVCNYQLFETLNQGLCLSPLIVDWKMFEAFFQLPYLIKLMFCGVRH